MILIVGLGNQDKKYLKTRHNLGFQVIDEFATKRGLKFSKKNTTLISRDEFYGKEIIIAKPLTFMNNSGKSVKSLITNYRIKITNIWVVHDDIDIPLGKIRIVKNRGAAGHKGVQSIINEIGTKDFVRFRIGICPKEKPKSVDRFVIQIFNKKEGEIIENGCQAIEIALIEGLEKAKQKYNQ